MMEILNQVSSTQFVFTAAAVAVVLVCAALVFVFGFHSAEPPQFDKLPLVLEDKKSSSKKKQKKDKVSTLPMYATIVLLPSPAFVRELILFLTCKPMLGTHLSGRLIAHNAGVDVFSDLCVRL